MLYDPRPGPAEGLHVNRIHYVNSLPGAGKTRAALMLAREVLDGQYQARDPKRGFILAYAAPTHRLLVQFKRELRKTHPISSVVLIEPREGFPVARQFYGLVNGINSAAMEIAKMPNGSVLLMTHECALAVEANMAGKNRVSFIFDEARQCMQTSMTLRVPVPVISFLQDYIDIPEYLSERNSVARWTWRAAHTLTEHELREVWTRHQRRISAKQFDSVWQFLDILKAGSQHVWVEFVGTDDSPDIVANVTLSPMRLFANYGRVLILSAYFEHSQMYYMLKRREIDLTTERGIKSAYNLKPEERVVLVDVTDELIDRSRIQRIIDRRLSATTITYVLKNESLSKYHIRLGVVVEQTSRRTLNKLSADYYTAHTAAGGTKKPPSFRVAMTSMSAETPTQDNGDPIFKRKGAGAGAQLLSALNVSKYSVVQYLALASLQIQRSWLKRKKIETEPLLLCVNARESSLSKSRVWDTEGLTTLLNAKDHRVTEVPVVCQGLNEWMSSNTAAFMATVKMSKDQRDFLTALLPGYDPDLDRTVDQCIQFVFRSSLRDAKSRSKVLVIVSDERLAQKLCETVGGQTSVEDPESIVRDWRPKSIAVYVHPVDPEVRKTLIKRYQSTDKGKKSKQAANRKWAQSEEGKQYLAINQRITRRRARLKNDPTNKQLRTEIDALLTERNRLKRSSK